ncbi:MAG TPA: hypothetical protein VGL81_31180 [Polyangiaceae bacterium]
MKRPLGGFGAGVTLVVGWAVAILANVRLHDYNTLFGHLHNGIEDAIYRIFSGFPALQEVVHRFHLATESALLGGFAMALAAGTLLVPLAFMARMIARARLRAGHPDPLDRVRRWTSRPARRVALVAAFPVLSQAFMLYEIIVREFGAWSPSYYLVAGLVGGLAQLPFARGALRALLAPTLAVRSTGDLAPVEIGADEIRFNAVAVTRESQAAVAALAAVTLGVVGWLISLPTLALFKDPRVFTVLPVYILVAAGSALVFRGASRISVGVDGVYVGGTSRPRFFAYSDLDEARVKAGDIELVRGDRVVLRLQLHGEDATRRDAIMARIHEGLARVKDVERDAAANFVTSRSTDKVAQSARGGGDYRMPSVSHDALWSLVEGSAVAAPTRTAAAEALLSTGGIPERERLRVAAAHCADPHVRVALEELADDAVDYGEPQTKTSRSPARM